MPYTRVAVFGKRIACAKCRRSGIIQEAPVQLVGARLGDECDLADGPDVGAVVCHIDTEFLETFDELHQRSDLSAVLSRAYRNAVDRLVGLVPAAARETPKSFASSSPDHPGRKSQEIVKLAGIQWQALELIRIFRIADARSVGFDQGRARRYFN